MAEHTDWRSVPDYPDYLASSEGEIVSLRRGTPRRMSQVPSANGYIYHHLFNDIGRRTFTAHEIVAMTFIGQRPPGRIEVRHLDGKRTNNAVRNLAWGTPTENAADQRRHGTNHNIRKVTCPRGHTYDEANTRVEKSGSRRCRTCARQHQRAYAMRQSFAAAGIEVAS